MLKALGSGLLVAHDQPEVFIKELMDRTLQTTVVYQQEVCDEERRVENALKE
jgi:deoxyribodipyrimidine photolyase